MDDHPRLPDDVRVLERGWLSSNNVLLLGHARCALVDSGYATHAEQTLALVRHGLASRPLDLLLNTHLHSDHCGGNSALQEQYPELRTLIPPGEADAVDAWDESKLSYRATGQHCPRFRFDGILAPGSAVQMGARTWEVHAAPGHDPHAVLLFEPEARLLISGDALWEKGFGIVFPEMWGEPSFDEVAATLDLIGSLSPTAVIPGHGPVFFEVGRAIVTARQRLEAFVLDPLKHARHAMKVLLKFKLLDAKRISREELQAWLECAGYLEQVRRRFAHDQTLAAWSHELLVELAAAGAVRIEGNVIFDEP